MPSPPTRSPGCFFSTRLDRPKPPIFTLSQAGDCRYTSPPCRRPVRDSRFPDLAGRPSSPWHIPHTDGPFLRSCLLPALVLAISAMMANGPDTVVVCPPTFVEALRPWIAYRTAQGHRFAFVPNALSAEQIRAEIRAQAKMGDLKYVVLVGDAEPTGAWDSAVRTDLFPRSWPLLVSTCGGSPHPRSRRTIGTPIWTMTVSRTWRSVACPPTVRRTWR